MRSIYIKINTLVLLLVLTCFWACKTQDLGQPDPIPNYEDHITNWKHQRQGSLTKPDGWYSLVGLTWLKEGGNSCGSAESNQIVLPPDAPSVVGVYYLENGKVKCTMQEQDGLTNLSDDNCGMSYGALSWQLIERGGNFGVRVRDSLRPTRIRLRAIEYFDIDPAYRVYAKWNPAEQQDSVLMRNVLDMEYMIPVEGTLTFKLNDQQHTLTALDGGPNDLFLIFSDQSTGEKTYGGGRYLYCSRPNNEGVAIIDFNKSHNPPCAFTQFATCLLPRPEDHLPINVLVGEKNYGNH